MVHSSPPQSLWRVSCQALKDDTDPLINILEPLVDSVSWMEGSPYWSIECFSRDPLILDSLKETLSKFCHNKDQEPFLSLRIETLSERNWLQENFSSFPMIRVAGFCLYGSHHERPETEDLALWIDAATAFGSGHHETTQGCLQAIQDIQDHVSWRRALDLGCGSGVLALALAALAQRSGQANHHILACDNDIEAIKVAKQNTRRNGLEDYIEVLFSNGFSNIDPSYDLIIANILAEPLKELASDIYKNLCPKGHLILSGILNTQSSIMIDLYEDQGFKLKNHYIFGDWSTILFQKEKKYE